MLRFYHYATEPRRGDSDALYHAYADRLEALLAAPRLTGKVKGLSDARALLCALRGTVGRGRARVRRALRGGEARDDLRTVFLCGDIYLRVDEWGNDDLQRKLADQGLRVIFEPFGEIFELLALRDAREHGLATRQGAKRLATLKFMRYVVKRLLRRRAPPPALGLLARCRRGLGGQRTALRRLPVRRVDPQIGGALLTWSTQAGRRRGRGLAARLRSGAGERGAAAPRRRVSAALRLQRRRPARRVAPGRICLAAARPRSAPARRSASDQGRACGGLRRRRARW